MQDDRTIDFSPGDDEPDHEATDSAQTGEGVGRWISSERQALAMMNHPGIAQVKALYR